MKGQNRKKKHGKGVKGGGTGAHGGTLGSHISSSLREKDRDELSETGKEWKRHRGVPTHTSGALLLIDVLEGLGGLWFLLFLLNFGAVGRDGLDQLLLLLAGVLHDDDAACMELVTHTRARALVFTSNRDMQSDVKHKLISTVELTERRKLQDDIQ